MDDIFKLMLGILGTSHDNKVTLVHTSYDIRHKAKKGNFQIKSVRVQFEIGHEASVRTKKTPDGFTHDWEVFVKGADNTDIQYFVDKVVFHLHATFPKPRRVIKEPPYVVKESGYAGFVLPIDVYLKNKEEPKKISFQYDLTLQNSGPPISRVLREPRVFQNPSEDFRRKLIRGGGVGVDTPNEVQMEDQKPSSSLSINKIKPTESPSRKHKIEMKLNDPFSDLFGPPIRRITPEPKKISDLARKLSETDKDKKKPPKPHKEEKELTKEKEKYVDRDKAKERDKVKDKTLKQQQQPIQITKCKDEFKKLEDKERKKDDNEEKKKKKEERDKKEKHKEIKELDKQMDKEIRKEKKDVRDSEYLKRLNSSKSHENRIPSDKNNSESLDKEKERSEKEKHKHRHKKKEKEKNRDKEKHKKEKDKNDRDSRERNREKEKISKKRHEEVKEREEKNKKKSRTPSPCPEKVKKGPLNALLDELGSSDSASPLSEGEDSIPSFKLPPKATAKLVPENKIQPSLSPKIKTPSSNSAPDAVRGGKDVEKHQKPDEFNVVKSKRDKSPSKKNKRNDLDNEKRRSKEQRRQSTSSDREKDDEEGEKRRREKEEMESFEKDRLDEEKPKSNKKSKESNRKRKREKGMELSSKPKKEAETDKATEIAIPQSVGMEPMEMEETRKCEKFTKEYVAQLRDLQHRIMTLEDNEDLQKVVQVIAETGQYEITKKTFDFDLCALDGGTIRKLQEFFSHT